MTSKISSGKLLKESLKHSGALGILLLAGYFCYLPLGGMLFLRMERQIQAGIRASELGKLMYRFAVANPFPFFLTFGSALLLGILQFSYLHDAAKLDFYHSLPLRREKLFAIRYGAGAFLWFLPFAGNLLLFLLLCAVNGITSLNGASLAGLLFRGLLAHSSCFLLVYGLSVLAMMLTEKLFAAATGFLVFCGYVPALRVLAEFMMEVSFASYYPRTDLELSTGVRISPLYVYIKTCQALSALTFPWDLLLAQVLIAVLLIILCLIFYRRRGFERVGRAMAFPVLARLIKFLLVVPISLLCSVAFYDIARSSVVWGVIGWGLGLILASGMIEFIYRLDIREIFQDRRQLLFSALVSLGILSVFHYDLFGYDRWMPTEEKVASAAISLSYPLQVNYQSIYQKTDLPSEGTSYELERVTDPQGTNGTAVGVYTTRDIALVQDLVEHSTLFQEDQADSSLQFVYSQVVIDYRMEDGTKKIRRYDFSSETAEQGFENLWAADGLKEAMYPVLSVDPQRVAALQVRDSTVGAYSPYFDYILTLSEDGTAGILTQEAVDGSIALTPEEPLTQAQIEAVTKTFQKELAASGIDEMLENAGEYTLTLFYKADGGKLIGEAYTLNAAFPETKELLMDYGFDLGSV